MRKILLGLAILGIIAGIFPHRAGAATVQLFRNSKGTLFMAGCGFGTRRLLKIDFTKHKKCWDNKARALRITGPVNPATRIRLFDSNTASSRFDWVDIAVTRAIPPKAVLFIPNLERSYTGYFIWVKYHRTEQLRTLNGNVSRLEIYPGKKTRRR